VVGARAADFVQCRVEGHARMVCHVLRMFMFAID
jgi:hypothetical protein